MNTRHRIARFLSGCIVVATYALITSIAACGQEPAFQVQETGAVGEKSGDAHEAEDINPTSVTSGTPSTNFDGCKESCDLKKAILVQDGANNLPPGTDGNDYVVLAITQSQPQLSKLDVLWIVDSSGSMAEEQAYLGQNFSSFITSLSSMSLDFQTAVTTTDVCQDQTPSDLAERRCPVGGGGSASTHLRGSFVGTSGRKVLKKSDSDLVTKFKSYTNVGTNGSGFEHGLKGAQLAIEKSLNGQNEALIRSNSFLSVIVVSDEEDDGIGMWMTDGSSGINYHTSGQTNFRYTDQDFSTYANSALGAGKYSVSTITGMRDNNGNLCTSAHSQPFEEGTQYIKAAQKTGGIAVSICEPNWSTLLTKIAQDLPGQITQFTLEGSVVPETILVKVNGVENTDWTYVESSKAVKFNPGKVPPPGASITVTYFAKK